MIDIRRQKASKMLQSLESNSVDLVLTDPPYNVNLDYDEYEDNLEEEEYWEWLKQVLEECYRVIKEDGAVCIVTPITQQRKWLNFIHEELSLDYLDTHIWCRSNLLGFKARGFNHATYPVYILEKEKHEIRNPDYNDFNSMNYMEVPSPQTNFSQGRVHPAQQPVKLYDKFVVKSSPENGLVVDPFLGSGTAAVAAKKWSREFIGCDISEEYVEKAKKRVAETSQQLRYKQEVLAE